MSSDSQFNIIDLLSDPDFRSWVRTGAFRDPDNTWSEWRAANPHYEEVVTEAIAILLASQVDEYISESEVEEIVTGTWDRIDQHNRNVKPLFRWWWAAASVAVLITGLWLVSGRSGRQDLSGNVAQPEVSESLERVNVGQKPMLVILPDSSSALLLPGSRLRFPAHFAGNTREVELLGEAFFEISKNADKPFFVHTKTITTRVVGTSFSVRSFDREPKVSVVVKTGKVTVYQNPGQDKYVPENPVTLLPDQQISYDKEKRFMSQPAATVTVPKLTLETASFEFVDTPVTAILDSIGNAYGLKLNYNEASLKNCILTTSLYDTPLQGKLKIICRALGRSASYQITDTEIEILASGCD